MERLKRLFLGQHGWHDICIHGSKHPQIKYIAAYHFGFPFCYHPHCSGKVD